jgi:alcohol dehydrogenase
MPEFPTIGGLLAGLDVAADVAGFVHAPCQEVRFQAGARFGIGPDLVSWGCCRPLVVTDPGILAAGHGTPLMDYLRGTGLEPVLYSEVRENPTTRDVDRCLRLARESGIDSLIGFGGGSSMDTAKGVNFLFSNGGEMKDYWGVGKATRPMLPYVAIPTTSGTGSECQSFALIADETTHQKMACGDKKAAARVAVLDPEVTLTQPFKVTAHTGIDAVSHAVETLVTNKGTDVSRAYSLVAWRLLRPGLERVLADPGDAWARSAMHLGAAYAGTAIENSMLGAAHACANPLTALFDVVHGDAVGVMLPHVVRFNAADPVSAALYAGLGEEDLPGCLTRLLEQARMPVRLSEMGVTGDNIPALAALAEKQWTAAFNPRPLVSQDFEELYRAAL